jgi:hypothetical protein
VFIGGVVIQNATDDFAGWKVPLDPIEEPDELLMAVADWNSPTEVVHLEG